MVHTHVYVTYTLFLSFYLVSGRCCHHIASTTSPPRMSNVTLSSSCAFLLYYSVSDYKRVIQHTHVANHVCGLGIQLPLDVTPETHILSAKYVRRVVCPFSSFDAIAGRLPAICGVNICWCLVNRVRAMHCDLLLVRPSFMGQRNRNAQTGPVIYALLVVWFFTRILKKKSFFFVLLQSEIWFTTTLEVKCELKLFI